VEQNSDGSDRCDRPSMDHANAWTRKYVLGVHCIKLVKNNFFKNIQDICAVILISTVEQRE
jgi:hypothetical protein